MPLSLQMFEQIVSWYWWCGRVEMDQRSLRRPVQKHWSIRKSLIDVIEKMWSDATHVRAATPGVELSRWYVSLNNTMAPWIGRFELIVGFKPFPRFLDRKFEYGSSEGSQSSISTRKA